VRTQKSGVTAARDSSHAGDPTSLETKEHPAPTASHGPDQPQAYEHRDAVAAVLLEGPKGFRWSARGRAMKDCGRAGVHVSCNACGAPHIVPYRCGARTCPVCARKAAAAIAARIEARIAIYDLRMQRAAWDGSGRSKNRRFRHLVLTCRAMRDLAGRFDPEALRGLVLRVRKAFARFWRHTCWGAQVRDPVTGRKRSRHDTSYVLGEEIAPGGVVHLHVLVYGEFVPQSTLQELWRKALGEKAIVHVSAIRGGAEGVGATLREVLKYATKGEKSPRANAKHAAAVELAFRNIKRVSIGGGLRQVRVSPSDCNSEDAKPEDLHASHQMQCAVCGEIGNWHWGGRVDPGVVMQNGGYGPLAATPPTSSAESS